MGSSYRDQVAANGGQLPTAATVSQNQQAPRLAYDPTKGAKDLGGFASLVHNNPATQYGRYSQYVGRDEANLNNLTDPTAKSAEQGWLDAYKGGIYNNPSLRKGRLGYDQRKEMYLQDYYKDQLKKNATNNYNNFNVDDYVKGESDATRRSMANNVMNSQKTVRGNANSSGMLFSGRRQMGEAQVGQQADQDFLKYQQNLVQDALQKKQQLASAITAPIQAQQSADMARQLQAQQMAAAAQQGQSQLLGAGIGLIGQGVGTGLGNKADGKNFDGSAKAPLAAPVLKTPR